MLRSARGVHLVFRVAVRTVFPKTALTDGFHGRDGLCLLRGTNWILKHNCDIFYSLKGYDTQTPEAATTMAYKFSNGPYNGVEGLNGFTVHCVWNVMTHAQKPYFVFRRNRRVHLNRRGRQFSRLLVAGLCASAVVMQDTPCSGCNYGTPFHPDPARKLSANLYVIYHCCVYSEKLMMMDRGTVRNM